MSHVAEVQLRPLSPRRALAAQVALFLAAAIAAVVLLATVGSSPPADCFERGGRAADGSGIASSTGPLAGRAGTAPCE